MASFVLCCPALVSNDDFFPVSSTIISDFCFAQLHGWIMITFILVSLPFSAAGCIRPTGFTSHLHFSIYARGMQAGVRAFEEVALLKKPPLLCQKLGSMYCKKLSYFRAVPLCMLLYNYLGLWAQLIVSTVPICLYTGADIAKIRTCI